MDMVLGLTVIYTEPLLDWLHARDIIITNLQLAFAIYWTIGAILFFTSAYSIPITQ